MGLRKASWVSPLIAIALTLGFAYSCGTYLSLRLSRRIVTVIDKLGHAANQIGMGDFSVRISVAGEDQLGSLVASFNEMTAHLETLREQDGYRIALERDITLAREVQQYLYPRSAPTLSGATVWGLTTPARIVSGDLYDFFSLFYGEYDSSSGLLRYINAGHCPPIFISETGEVAALSNGDLPIGLFIETTYHELQLTVSRGGAIVVYSDGLIDALNSREEEFGEERLVDYCRSVPKGATAQEICAALTLCIAEWSEGVDQFDDTTILVLKVD